VDLPRLFNIKINTDHGLMEELHGTNNMQGNQKSIMKLTTQ